MATIIKTTAGTFKAIIRRNGRLVKTQTFKRKQDARTWAQRIEGNKRALAAYGLSGATITFNELAEEYLTNWTGRDSINGRVKFWQEHLGAMKLISIDAHTIRGILDQYSKGDALRYCGSDEHGNSKLKPLQAGRSPATVNRARACLSSIFKYAIKERGYLNENPVSLVPSRTENNKRCRYLSGDERKALIAACKQSKWEKLYLLVLMALTTGARQSELLSLRWSDIDFKKRTATLHQTKNGEQRVLTFPPVLIKELQRFRQIGTELIFPSKKRPDKPFEFRKHWNQALQEAAIDDFRFHDLRHSAASMLVMNGATLYEAGQVLGHKTPHTTARYAHISVQHKQALTDRIMNNIEGLD